MCFNEEKNIHDRKAVAVTCEEGFVVGHLLHEIDTYLAFASILSSMEEKSLGLQLVEDSTRKQHMEEWRFLIMVKNAKELILG